MIRVALKVQEVAVVPNHSHGQRARQYFGTGRVRTLLAALIVPLSSTCVFPVVVTQDRWWKVACRWHGAVCNIFRPVCRKWLQ